jgi:membrane-associated protein
MQSPETALSLLTQYGYLAVFFLNFFEGSVVVLSAGFLSSQGYLNPLFLTLVIVLSDLAGDFLYYSLGRWGRKLSFMRSGGLIVRARKSSERIKQNPKKFLLLSKITYSVGFLIQIGAGLSHVEIPIFLLYNIIGTVTKTIVLVGLGYFFGSAFLFVNSVIGKVSIGVLFALLILIVLSYIKKVEKQAKLNSEE